MFEFNVLKSQIKSTQVDDDAMTSCEVYCKNDWDPVSDRCGSISPFIVVVTIYYPFPADGIFV